MFIENRYKPVPLWMVVVFFLLNLHTAGTSSLGYAMGGYRSAMNIENIKHPRIVDLLVKNEIEPQKWYWVDEYPINIHRNALNPALPLLERKKALVVDLSYYFENSLFLFVGYMFEDMTNEKFGEEVVLSRIISLSHAGKEVSISSSLRDRMKLDGRKNGQYFFKTINKSDILQEIEKEDVPFLREYYRILIDEDDKENIIEKVFKVNVCILEYFIYGYYPSGMVERLVKILLERGSKMSDQYKHLLPYNAYEMWFENNFEKPTHLRPPTKTPIYDTESNYWLPNILHD